MNPQMSAQNKLISERIVTAIEGHFRDWLMSGEHAEAVDLVAQIINESIEGGCDCLK